MAGAGLAGFFLGALVVVMAGGLMEFVHSPIVWTLFLGGVVLHQFTRRATASPRVLGVIIGFGLAGIVITGAHRLAPRVAAPGVVERVTTAREWRTSGWRYRVQTDRGAFSIFYRSIPKWRVGDRVSVYMQTLFYVDAVDLSDPAVES